MSKKPHIFNNAAEQNVHFINPNAQLTLFKGEYKPAQRAARFEDMLTDIAETAPKFIQHLIDINRRVLGDKATLGALQQTALGDTPTQDFKALIESYDISELSQYLSLSYSDKIARLRESYIISEQILDQWTAQHKGTAKVYDFPAFQDYYLKHPLNTKGTPLEKDHGNDERFALEGPLFRLCIKSPYSSYSKLFSDYKSPATPDTPFKKELLTDIQRARIACPDMQVYDFIKVASHHNPHSLTHANSAENIGAILEDNRIIAPKKMTGHRVFFQKFALPTDSSNRGSLVELQILPESIMNANDITHILMDKADDLLNVPKPALNARIHASFLYNICSYIHKTCAETGGFNDDVIPGLAPQETILNMMLADQRPDTFSAVLSVQNTVHNILNAIKNGKDCAELTDHLLGQIEFATGQSLLNWKNSERHIHELSNQIEKRINLITGKDTKVSSKDYREASILREVQKLIYDQAADTNMFPNLKPQNGAHKSTGELEGMISKNPDLAENIIHLITVTEKQTTDVILGHPPNANTIIYHSLGLVNQELINNAPDKKALSDALNKSAAISQKGHPPSVFEQTIDSRNDQLYNILNRKRCVEYYQSAPTGKTAADNNYIGVQRDIFGNINVAVEFKNGRTKKLDMPALKNKFAHSFVRIDDPMSEIPETIRKDIAKRVVRFSPDGTDTGSNLSTSGYSSQPRI